MDSLLFWLIPAASVLALCFAYYFHKQMMKESEGTPQMIKIAAAVRKGAMSYLKQQYKIVGWVFLGLRLPDGRFLLRTLRIPRYEGGNVCFGTHSKCCP